MQLSRGFVILFAVEFVVTAFCRAQIVIAPDHPHGVYQTGESVRWRIEWKGGSNAPAAHYKFLKGGYTAAAQGDLILSNNLAELQSTFDAPGTMLLEVKWPPENPTNRATAGAVASQEKITLSASAPADFDEFWQAKLKELAAVPANARVERVDIVNTNVSFFRITMDNIRATHIRGQLAKPAREGKFPALLIVQWAGVYRLERNWVTDRAREGWLALDIEAHDLPIDEPESFYRQQFAGPLNNYWSIGNDDRDTSYYLRMYLSCRRAAEYLSQRGDWDGKTLVVMGDSQGGMQALMLAGLFPKKISAAIALVPAGCDMLGPDAGRAPGWPNWYFNTEGKDAKRVRESSRYYDVANFAARIKCPVLVGLGLRDETCPPAGVFAAFNQITSPKELVILPMSGHQDEHGSQADFNQRRYNVWLPALVRGEAAPVRP